MSDFGWKVYLNLCNIFIATVSLGENNDFSFNIIQKINFF